MKLIVRVCETRWSETEIVVDAAEYAAWKKNALPGRRETDDDRTFRQAVSQQIRNGVRDNYSEIDYSATVEVIDNDTGEELHPYLQPSTPQWCQP